MKRNWKKWIAFLLVAVMIGSAAPLGVFAEEAPTSGACGEDLTWALEDGVLTIAGTGNMNRYRERGVTYVIFCEEEEDESYPPQYAPWTPYREDVRQLVIEAGVASVVVGALDFPNLVSIRVSADNATYSSDARGVLFNKAQTKLYLYPSAAEQTEYVIPDTVEKLEYCSFTDCVNLTDVTVPGSVKSVSTGFYDCRNIQKVTLEEGVEKIENYAFYGCGKLKEIVLPQSLTSIGWGAFSYCALESVTIPDGIYALNYSTFEHCAALREVQLSDNIYRIEMSAFRDCTSLQSVTLPSDLREIGTGAFFGCTALKEIVIPENVREIGKKAFAGCTSLNCVRMQSTQLEWVEEDILLDTPFYADASNWEDDVLYLGTCLVRCNRRDALTYTVKDGTRVIASEAFRGSAMTGGVILPDGIVGVGDDAFAFSTIRFVHFPAGVERIGSGILRSGILRRSYAYICCPKATDNTYEYAVENDIRFYADTGAHNDALQLWRSTWFAWKLYTWSHPRMAAMDEVSPIRSLYNWISWRIGEVRG